MSTRFSIVVPTLGRVERLRRTLENLRTAEPRPYEVIVVDADANASAEEAVLGVADVPPTFHYLNTLPSLTWQRNLGIEKASGDVVVFLDDDVELQRDLFARLERAYADYGVVGVTGQVTEPDYQRLGGPASRLRRLLLGRRRLGTFTRYGYPRYVVDADRPRDVEFMPGCFMSARLEAAKQVRFDERLGLYALAEDEDFSYRLSHLGRILYVPDILVVHEKLGFRGFDSRRFGRLVVQNRAYLFRKNFRQTPLARIQFGLLIFGFIGHRLLNREWSGALGIVEGSLQVLRGKA